MHLLLCKEDDKPDQGSPDDLTRMDKEEEEEGEEERPSQEGEEEEEEEGEEEDYALQIALQLSAADHGRECDDAEI